MNNLNNLNKDELAEMVSQLLWKKLILPALSIQFVLGLLCLIAQPMLAGRCWSAERTGDDIAAAAPDAGQPPAPPVTVASEQAPSKTADLKSADELAAPAHSAAAVIAAEASAAEVSAAAELLPAEPTPTADVVEPASVAAITSASEGDDNDADKKDRDAEDGNVDNRDSWQPETVRQLSVPPKSQMLLPEDRPAWVGAAPDLSTSNHRLFVGSFPCATPDEADAALDDPMVAVVDGYLDEIASSSEGTYDFHLSADFIRKNLLDSSTEFMARLSTEEGPLYQKWVVLVVTPEHREHFARSIAQLRQRHRIKGLAAGLVGVLTLTGLAHVGFNLRRRRYPNNLPPATYALLPNEPAVTDKRKRRGSRWLVGAGLLTALAVSGALTLVPPHQRSPATVVHAEPYEVESMADRDTRIERRARGHRARISIRREHQIGEVTCDGD